ncbi:hypothetical protein [Microbacterium mcarthurae (nom. nud.)]|uniref:DinB-like domain-containing protein n=1 Tax=Microbacterium mcarthurae TaxID=3035918 RepID=A0ABW9GBX8_9MICO
MPLTPADLALRVLGMYQEVHATMERLIRARTLSLEPQFGIWLEKRLGRLTDEDRIRAFLAIATDVGRGEAVVNVAGVMGTAKKTRDRLAHAAFLHVTEEQELRGVHRQRVFDVPPAELDSMSWRLLWVVEHVLLVEEMAGASPALPFQYVRQSMTHLAAAPPDLRPPRGPIADPVRIPRFLVNDNIIEEMRDVGRIPHDYERPQS